MNLPEHFVDYIELYYNYLNKLYTHYTKGPSIYYVIGGGGSDLRFWRSEISIAKEFLSGGAMTAMTEGGEAIFPMT